MVVAMLVNLAFNAQKQMLVARVVAQASMESGLCLETETLYLDLLEKEENCVKMGSWHQTTFESTNIVGKQT